LLFLVDAIADVEASQTAPRPLALMASSRH